ncbi:MAG: hypothetical protein DRJ67_04305 [Thermoprotei archaeon]|nr:MAG: hypothetical protein DRJ67_04305 [Thermoprotei archaeon]
MAEESKGAEVAPSGLRPWLVIYAIITPPISFLLNNWMQTLTTWWAWPGIYPLPPFLFLLIFYAISKVTGWKITPQELAVFFVVNFMVSGCAYGEYGILQWTLAPVPTWNIAIPLYAQMADPYKEIFRRVIPPFLAPKSPEALEAWWRGGPFILSEWLPAITFWTLWVIAIYGGSIFWSFFLRKPLIEVERLPFVGVLGHAYIFRWYTEEVEGKPLLFNFRLRLTKLFWVGFIIGFILVFPDVIRFFLPGAAAGVELRYHYWDLKPMTWGILPGADTMIWITTPEIFMFMFAPLDMLFTYVVWHWIWAMIYPVVGITLGFLPAPAGPVGWDYWGYTTGPFKFGYFNVYGVMFGLGIWALYTHRRHIINVFKAGLGIDKRLPQEEEGVPYKVVVIGGIIMYLLAVTLMSLAGAPAPWAFIAIIWYILMMYGWTRMMGEVQEFMGSVYHQMGQAYDFGVAMGFWGPPPARNDTALISMMMWQALGSGGSRMSALAMHHHFKSYKVAYMLRTRARDIFIISLITLVMSAISAEFIWPWWMCKFGGHTGVKGYITYETWGLPTTWSYTYGTPPPITSAERWALTIGGIAFTFIVYMLRAKFTWFILNPVGIAATFIGTWWATGLIALIVKYIVLKVGGSKAYEDFLVPLAAGVLAGYGINYIVTAWLAFFTIGIPEFLARL